MFFYGGGEDKKYVYIFSMQKNPFIAPFIITDTEYTSWQGAQERGWSGPGEHREIVQIAAIKVDPQNGFAETAAFDMLIRPEINPLLSDYFKTLTGIRQRDVDSSGVTFARGVEAFKAFCAGLPVWSYGRDDKVMLENCELYGLTPDLEPFNDVRAFVKAQGYNPDDYTSGTLYKAVGADLSGHTHNALFDCRSVLAFLVDRLS